MTHLVARTPPTTEPSEINPYTYPEFSGWAGERYLKHMLRQILPMALYRTWEIFVEYQARGNACYLGTARLAAIAGRTVRTIQKNLAVLVARQLVVERAERRVVGGSREDRRTHVVVVKDFSRLYALAHDYHEWLSCADYVAPDRAVVALIAQDDRLVARVRRFDNYRRLLYHPRPGPVPRPHEEDTWFSASQEEPAVMEPCERHRATLPKLPMEKRATIPPAEAVAIPLAKDSPKRIRDTPRKKHHQDGVDDSIRPISQHMESTSTRIPGQTAHALANRDAHPRLSSDTSCAAADEAVSSLPTFFPSTLPPSEQRQGEQPTKTPAGEVPLQPVLATHERAAPGPSERCQRATPPASDPMPPLAQALVQTIAAPFGDRNPKGSVTRVRSILAQAPLDDPAEIALCLVRASTLARRTTRVRPQYWNPRTGQANRMPLFCALFERFVQARLQADRSDYSWEQMQADIADDACLTRWWSVHHVAPGDRIRDQEDTWGAALSEGTTRLSDAFLRHHCCSRRSQGEPERERRGRYARSVLAQLSRAAVGIHDPMIWEEHLLCGCPLYHTQRGQAVCALCVPDPTWSQEVRALIRSIVDSRPKGEPAPPPPAGGDTQQFAVHPLPEGRFALCHSSPAGWIERANALAWGQHALGVLTRYGYGVTMQMQVRRLAEGYQVVLTDASGELVLETPEQVQMLLDQVEAQERVAHTHGQHPAKEDRAADAVSTPKAAQARMFATPVS